MGSQRAGQDSLHACHQYVQAILFNIPKSIHSSTFLDDLFTLFFPFSKNYNSPQASQFLSNGLFSIFIEEIKHSRKSFYQLCVQSCPLNPARHVSRPHSISGPPLCLSARSPPLLNTQDMAPGIPSGFHLSVFLHSTKSSPLAYTHLVEDT